MSPALQRPHVLIVSDDPELTAFLGEGLVYAGFWTSAIASAVQALEVFRLRSFDIMVLDAALGGIGALELLRRLRGRSDRAATAERTDIPILVIAASSSELDPVLAKRAGADQVILAPIELEQARGRPRPLGRRLARGTPRPQVGRRSGVGSGVNARWACQIAQFVATCLCTDTAREASVSGTSSQYRSSLTMAGIAGRHRYGHR